MTKNITPKKEYPMVSVCTPTFNRRPFMKNMFQCFMNQDYPKNRIEWIIVDDGTDKVKDLIESSNIPQIRYFEVDRKMTLGEKRNYMHNFVKGSIVVYMDDDDYYPPERISHAVEKLQGNTSALCAGSSEIYIYFKHINAMYQCGPYGPNHATAGTFAFRSELLKHTKYEETASVAEERAFLKDYTVPFVQLDPLKTILVFSHEHNSFDKRKMLIDMHPEFMRVSDKTVDTFIRKKNEKSIKNFFLNEITGLLKNYEQGEAKMKPDVVKQIAEIEKEREVIKEQLMKQAAGNGPIMLQRPGEEPIQLSNQDVVNMLVQQQNVINELNQKLQQSGGGGTGSSGGDSSISPQRINDLENMVSMLQKQLIEKTKLVKSLNVEINDLKTKLSNEQSKNAKNKEKEDAKFFKVPIEIVEITPPKKPKTKSDPEVMVDVSD
jgi:glycosyltransferase involved in cell wall biosynthesis